MATQALKKVMDAETAMDKAVEQATAEKEKMLADARAAEEQAMQAAEQRAREKREKSESEVEQSIAKLRSGQHMLTEEKKRHLEEQTRENREKAVAACMSALFS